MNWISINLDRNLSNYILLEETKMKELRAQAIERVMKYEEKAFNSKKKLIKKCIKNLERDLKSEEDR